MWGLCKRKSAQEQEENARTSARIRKLLLFFCSLSLDLSWHFLITVKWIWGYMWGSPDPPRPRPRAQTVLGSNILRKFSIEAPFQECLLKKHRGVMVIKTKIKMVSSPPPGWPHNLLPLLKCRLLPEAPPDHSPSISLPCPVFYLFIFCLIQSNFCSMGAVLGTRWVVNMHLLRERRVLCIYLSNHINNYTKRAPARLSITSS